MLRLALTPRWLGSLLLVLGLVTGFVFLSAWQIDRAATKNARVDNPELARTQPFNSLMGAQGPMPGSLVDQRVKLTGRFLPDAQVVVEDRYLNGHKGYWVVTMFAPDGARFSPQADRPAVDKPTAIAVVRGWTDNLETAQSSRASQESVTLTARIAPIEGPRDTNGLPQGVVRSLSASQLVNLFEVYTYSGFLFPDEAPGGSIGTRGLSYVPYKEPQSGGFDLQSAFYAAEWLIFAGFALYMWFRLLRDEYNSKTRAERTAVEYVIVKQAGEKMPKSQNGDHT